MSKLYKLIIFCSLMLSSFLTKAQLQEYIDSESTRISTISQTEIEINQFIDSNFNKYKLSNELEQEAIVNLKEIENFTDLELEKALDNAKRNELRKLYFNNYPDKLTSYRAKTIPTLLSQQCVNGDFENGAAGYTFWADLHPQPQSGTGFFQSCSTPTVLTTSNVLAPTINNFNSRATIINSTAPGYVQFDPVLSTFGVNVPTLNYNGGTQCIKLNNTAAFGSSDVSTVSRYFPVINQSTIDFNFSLIMDNKPGHAQNIQPYFRARVLDQYNNVVDEFCIIANPVNCLFSAVNVSSDRRILYTGWICARLNVGEILNQPGTIEFSVSDCQPSAHFGTVYIDNICGFTCDTPQLGALNTNPTNLNCPDVNDITPIQVCGTYQSPFNSTLSSIVLNITQGSSVIATITTPTQLTSNTFCFSFLPSVFGANPQGNFEFEIDASFSVNCSAGTFTYTISDTSANIGPDVSFNNCCLSTLTVTSPTDDVANTATVPIKRKERSNWIKASNLIKIGNNILGNGVVYHAENFVELLPGFEALKGSQFAAYPEGCTGGFVYKQVNDKSPKVYEPIVEDINLISLINNGFTIVPNPSSSWIEINLKNGMFNNVSITTIDGKMVLDKHFEQTDKFKLDISSYLSGVYIVNIVSQKGENLTEKLIKK